MMGPPRVRVDGVWSPCNPGGNALVAARQTVSTTVRPVVRPPTEVTRAGPPGGRGQRRRQPPRRLVARPCRRDEPSPRPAGPAGRPGGPRTGRRRGGPRPGGGGGRGRGPRSDRTGRRGGGARRGQRGRRPGRPRGTARAAPRGDRRPGSARP